MLHLRYKNTKGNLRHIKFAYRLKNPENPLAIRNPRKLLKVLYALDTYDERNTKEGIEFKNVHSIDVFSDRRRVKLYTRALKLSRKGYLRTLVANKKKMLIVSDEIIETQIEPKQLTSFELAQLWRIIKTHYEKSARNIIYFDINTDGILVKYIVDKINRTGIQIALRVDGLLRLETWGVLPLAIDGCAKQIVDMRTIEPSKALVSAIVNVRHLEIIRTCSNGVTDLQCLSLLQHLEFLRAIRFSHSPYSFCVFTPQKFINMIKCMQFRNSDISVFVFLHVENYVSNKECMSEFEDYLGEGIASKLKELHANLTYCPKTLAAVVYNGKHECTCFK